MTTLPTAVCQLNFSCKNIKLNIGTMMYDIAVKGYANDNGNVRNTYIHTKIVNAYKKIALTKNGLRINEMIHSTAVAPCQEGAPSLKSI